MEQFSPTPVRDSCTMLGPTTATTTTTITLVFTLTVTEIRYRVILFLFLFNFILIGFRFDLIGNSVCFFFVFFFIFCLQGMEEFLGEMAQMMSQTKPNVSKFVG